ncbi:hypothetical protein AGLY_012089 [Aphis glycines]|uniref:SAM domain-containing protein n=1 Tax=Aphis glycines TaxID=307491 RepID=A0A6G0TB83_APHGL|nr:hypothetical protein AGLY_012089 [Aphis glycines]
MEWNLPENIIDNFREEEIDKESLLNLTQEMLRELIPKIGLRANIYNKISLEKQAKQQILEVGIDMENIASGSSNTNININEIQKFDIIDVDKNEIVYNNDNVPLTEYTVNIIKSKEQNDVYNILIKKEGNKVTPNRGKLWDNYCNMRKVIRQITQVTSTETNLTSNIQQIPANVENENIEDNLLWLKNNVSPWDTVVEKWKCTFSQRYNNLLKNVDEKKTYFDELDFNELFPNKEFMYLTSNDTTATLKIFVEFFNPVNMSCKHTIDNLTKKNWRPSKLEIRQGFIHYINDISQLHEIDDAKWTKNKLLKLTVQPYMVFVGPELRTQDRLEVSSFYVVINYNFFKLESALKACEQIEMLYL